MKTKKCLICDNDKFIASFPFNTIFNKKVFNYKKCTRCKFVKIDPNPNKDDLKILYDDKLYHQNFYNFLESDEYQSSVNYLNKFLNNKIKLLDFGCGNGHFISEIDQIHECYGVEYNLDTIENCKEKFPNASFFQMEEIENNKFDNFFDVVHLGDVLEHVVDPLDLLDKLYNKIEEKGLLYIEGPIERNFSIVNFVIIFFGNIKKILMPNLKNKFQPYHLYFTNFQNQVAMINKNKKYKVINYEVFETGWPYNSGGPVKIFIAKLGIIFSKINIFGFRIGNRFRIILQKI